MWSTLFTARHSALLMSARVRFNMTGWGRNLRTDWQFKGLENLSSHRPLQLKSGCHLMLTGEIITSETFSLWTCDSGFISHYLPGAERHADKSAFLQNKSPPIDSSLWGHCRPLTFAARTALIRRIFCPLVVKKKITGHKRRRAFGKAAATNLSWWTFSFTSVNVLRANKVHSWQFYAAGHPVPKCFYLPSRISGSRITTFEN